MMQVFIAFPITMGKVLPIGHFQIVASTQEERIIEMNMHQAQRAYDAIEEPSEEEWPVKPEPKSEEPSAGVRLTRLDSGKWNAVAYDEITNGDGDRLYIEFEVTEETRDKALQSLRIGIRLAANKSFQRIFAAIEEERMKS